MIRLITALVLVTTLAACGDQVKMTVLASCDNVDTGCDLKPKAPCDPLTGINCAKLPSQNV